MDDQRTDREGGRIKWLPDNTPRRALPLTTLLLIGFIVWYWYHPNFWNLKGVVSLCLAVAVLIWDRFRVKAKNSDLTT